MDLQLNTYSPHIQIYLQVKDIKIRLSDVLLSSATLYSQDFEPCPPGTAAELVIAVDDKMSKQQVILHHGLHKDMTIFSFEQKGVPVVV